MNAKVKAIIKSNPIVLNTFTSYRRYKKECWNPDFHKSKASYMLSSVRNSRVYMSKDKCREIDLVFKHCDLKMTPEDKFFYSIDQHKHTSKIYWLVNNTTVNYELLLKKSLAVLLAEAEGSPNYNEQFVTAVHCIENYVDKIIGIIAKSKHPRKNELEHWFVNLKTQTCQGFEEALQRVLFVNQMFWQLGHELMGLGRLDTILFPYYEMDLKSGKISYTSAQTMITDFCRTLHKGYYLKSGSLPGDTGQIIIVGGKNEDGTYVDNDLTRMFIASVKELQLPDPKILLRVSHDMDRSLMEDAVTCIATGVGCPLLSNDDVVIPRLLEFGITASEAYNYMTSACWEPLIVGKSFDQNNQMCLNFMFPFERMLNVANLGSISNIDELMELYYKELDTYLEDVFNQLDAMVFEEDPVMSMFTENCVQNGVDISKGGAEYNNFGITTVALANVVESILNIKEFVFEEGKFTLDELNEIRISNYEGNEDVRELLSSSKFIYGGDDPEVIDLSNKILSHADSTLSKYTTKHGGKVKFGCSSPSYIDASKDIPASFDGRKTGEPFRVHISAKGNISYTELVSFASQLDYSGLKFNGNVVDYIVAPQFINNNFDKYVDFLLLAIDQGFFQMQMNVVGSDTLIMAKANPELFPDLIVRVWGFSAYFNELPDSYKDNLIRRALESEGKAS